ncbi:MAG: hypothetical protein ABJZ55_14230 [Fuerstiella sp.]
MLTSGSLQDIQAETGRPASGRVGICRDGFGRASFGRASFSRDAFSGLQSRICGVAISLAVDCSAFASACPQ